MLAKISRPRLSTVYQRAGLFNRLDAARREHSATLVNGPPGAGKTILVASYLRRRDLQCIWYQVDSGDEDVATFFYYFSQAAVPHLAPGIPALPDFDPRAVSDLTRFSRKYFSHFYAGLQSPFVVVLDSYQELSDGSPSHEVVQVACEEAPESCHVIIASREACPPSLKKMRCNHALSIIGPDDLVLSTEETRGIAESQGVKPLSDAATLALQTRSAGWMMGLVLVLERARRLEPGIDMISAFADGGEESVFDYFVGEVFRKLEADCRDLLLQSALLPKMTIPLVAKFTGSPKAGALLRELLGRNLFVTRHEAREWSYQFHPLFREFLLNQGVVRYPEAELAALYCNAAELLIADGDSESAIDLLEKARNWKRMTEVILAAASTLRAQGRIATLDAWMKKFPADLICTNPWLLYWQAIGKSTSSFADSQRSLEIAYRRFSALDDLPGMTLSWADVLNSILSIHTDFWQVDPWIAEFNERMKDRLGDLPPDLCARATLTFFIALSFRQPLHPDISVWLARVRKLLESETSADGRARLRQHLVTHHILRGEHAEAESVLSMLHYASHLPAAERPPRTVEDHVSDAIVAMHVGMGDRCLRAVSDGLLAADGTGNRKLDSVLLQVGAVMSLNRGELARTDVFLAAFERLAEAMPGVDRGAYYAVSAWRKFQTGEPTLALQLLGRAVAASEARGTPYYIAIDNLGLGLLLHLCGKTDAALRHLELGRSVGAGIGNSLIEYVYHQFSASIALDLGDVDNAHSHLADGMFLGRHHGYMHCFFFPQRVIARLCLTALEAGIEPTYVQSLIERNELTPDPSWPQSESWPWPLRIYTLGRFGVVKQGEVLRFTGKAQKKPLELLKALIAFGGRDVWEGKLADALWPEAEGDAAAQALATTLFRLRKLIGEQVIRRQEGRLTLDPVFCWVDCWAFERLSSDNSGDSPLRLKKMRKLHQGPFLDGADDAPWARPMRDRLNAKLARLLQILTGVAVIGASACANNEEGEYFPWLILEILPY